MFPLYHVNARYTSVLPAMLLDRGAVRAPRPLLGLPLLGHLPREGVTAFNFMGALVLMLFKQPERDDDADNPVRRAYGAPAPVAVLERFERRFGVELVEVYGSTELGACLENQPRRAADRLVRPSRRRTTRSRSTTSDDNPVAARRRGRDRGAPARAARHGGGVLRDARGDAGGVPEPLVPHRRPRPHGRGRLVLLRRPPQGRDPPARREHLLVGGRAGRQRPRRGRPSRRRSASRPSSPRRR